MKAPSCVCPVAPPSVTFTHLQFRHSPCSLLPSFFHLFFHLSSCLWFLPRPLVSRPSSSRVIFAYKARQSLWQAECLSVVGACRAKEQRVICGITSTALNCIKQLTDLFFFYDCNMRYLTYRCHKVQQTQVHRHARIRMLLGADGGVGDRCMYKLSEVFMVQTHPG